MPSFHPVQTFLTAVADEFLKTKGSQWVGSLSTQFKLKNSLSEKDAETLAFIFNSAADEGVMIKAFIEKTADGKFTVVCKSTFRDRAKPKDL